MSNHKLTLQAKLEQILQQLTDKTQTHQSGVHFDRLSVVERNLRIRANEQDALKAILATVSKHLPEKRTAMMVTHCPYCNRNFPTVEEEYNTAITEMENLLGGNDE